MSGPVRLRQVQEDQWQQLIHDSTEMVRALAEIRRVLGPMPFECPENECGGCSYEIAEAHRIADEALRAVMYSEGESE